VSGIGGRLPLTRPTSSRPPAPPPPSCSFSTGTYQKRLADVRILGELYNYSLFNSTPVFETLYLIITFGHESPELAMRIDPPDDYYRIRRGPPDPPYPRRRHADAHIHTCVGFTHIHTCGIGFTITRIAG